jgi:hypothetical protein
MLVVDVGNRVVYVAAVVTMPDERNRNLHHQM